MLSLPPIIACIERIRRYRRGALPRLPVCPVLPEVGGVPECIRPDGLVRECVLPIAILQRAGVIASIVPYEYIIGCSFANQEVVSRLYVTSVSIVNLSSYTQLTFVDAVPSCVLGLLMMISKTPSGTFSSVAVQDHVDTDAP